LQGRGGEPAEIGFGGPVGVQTALRLTCDASVTRIVTADRAGGATTDVGAPAAAAAGEQVAGLPPEYLQALPPPLRGPTQVLDVGRAQRTMTPAIRKALAVRDRGCVFPGCDRPPGWCDAHHVLHWVHFGRSSLRNGVLLCRYHHTFVHELGWHVQTGDDGAVVVSPPDDSPPDPPPDGAQQRAAS
jgi:hypothetical protein